MPNDDQRGGAAVLILAVVAAAAIGLGSAWWLAQPDRTLGQYDRLAGEIGCQCGTCPLRPIATCGCGFASGMLTELHELVDEGLPDQEVMSTLIVRYNESIRIKPASSGFELTAWAVPILLLTVGAVALAGTLVRWTQVESGEVEHPAETTAAPTDSSRLRELMEKELEEFGD